MNKKILSGAAIKNIAYVTMFIDHFFVVVFRMLMHSRLQAGYDAAGMENIYHMGRAVGRVSFILFAYLAVEGFLHTHSRKKYLLRLGIFGVISEIPFDLAFSGMCVDWGNQNVFFTLFLGVFALAVWEWACRREFRSGTEEKLFKILGAVTLCGCCAVAYGCQTDYKFMGVLLIFALYQTKGKDLSVQMAVTGCVMLFGTWGVNCLRYAGEYPALYLLEFSVGEMYGLFAFVPIAMYNGRKGRQLPKAFYYGFYPVHLLLLYGVARLIGGG